MQISLLSLTFFLSTREVFGFTAKDTVAIIFCATHKVIQKVMLYTLMQYLNFGRQQMEILVNNVILVNKQIMAKNPYFAQKIFFF